jgi:4-amino-4-deoxy-L-arabinose transferase-like glycosyltransferase
MTLSSTLGLLPRPRDAAEPELAGPPRRQRVPRAVRLAAALAGLAAIGAYLFVAVRRLDYPFALEYLEGNSLVEVHRILAGQPLYPAPSAGYVPDGYPPLYFLLSAAVARVVGVSYLALRLVSLVSSLACFALTARLVQRETGSLAAGTAAAGMFAATYFAAGTWFDIGRVDSLFLALSVGALYAARRMRGPRGAVAVGVLFAAAALTKQTGLAEMAAVTAVLLAGPRRRLAYLTAATEVALVAASAVVLRFTSGGWYTYYIFKQMSEHSLTYGNFGWFWTALLTATGLAAGAALIGARRVPLELLAACAALAVEGYATLVHSGGSINDMLPAYLAMALLAGLALGSGPARWAATASGALVLAQIAFLLASAHPSQAVPASATRAAGERLVAGMRAFGGDVAVPEDPGLSLQAGMTPAAVPGAVFDVVRATNRTGIVTYRHSAYDLVRNRQYSAIITSGSGAPLYDPPNLIQDYQKCVQPLRPQPGAAGPSTLLVPVSGGGTRPAVVWIPSGNLTCAEAISILNGDKAAAS